MALGSAGERSEAHAHEPEHAHRRLWRSVAAGAAGAKAAGAQRSLGRALFEPFLWRFPSVSRRSSTDFGFERPLKRAF